MFKHHKDLSLFDIKVRLPHRDIVLIRGNASECDAVPLEGLIKLSINEDMHVRKVRLTLTAEYTVDFHVRDAQRTVVDQVYERLCPLRAEWPNLLTSPEGEIRYGNYGDYLVKLKHVDSLKKGRREGSVGDAGDRSPGGQASGPLNFGTGTASGASVSTSAPARPLYLRTKSQPTLTKHHAPSMFKLPKSGVDGTPFPGQGGSHHSYLLPKGNYNMPFRIVLPANMCETVEGLRTGQLVYKLECTIERGRFEKSLHRAKHLRVVRTLHPQNLNLVESIDINNTWPGKVQYNVTIPRKGIAVGSRVPIHILVVPIAKGLRLRSINAVLVQHHHVAHLGGRLPEYEEIHGKQHLEISDRDRDKFTFDQWLVKTHFKVPESIREITPTTSLKDDMVVVKHRLRISIQLKNQEGHVSELRANLPVHVYISSSIGHVVGRHFEPDQYTHFLAPTAQEVVLFKHPTSTPVSEAQSPEDLEEEESAEPAPPLYQQHVHDKVYDLSLPQTPMEQFRSQENTPLALPNGSQLNISGYFDLPPIDLFLSLPKAMGPAPVTPSLDLNVLSKVPSYDEAVDEDVDDELAPPLYDLASSAPATPTLMLHQRTKSASHLLRRKEKKK